LLKLPTKAHQADAAASEGVTVRRAPLGQRLRRLVARVSGPLLEGRAARALQRRLGRRTVRAAWGAIVAVALIGGLLAVVPGGWRHHHAGPVTVHTSAGAVITSRDGIAAGSAGSASPSADGRATTGAGPAGAVANAGPGVSATGRTPAGALRHLPPLPKPSGTLPSVAGLTTLRPVDAIVTLPAAVTPAQVTALVHLQGLSAVELVDMGTVNLAGAPAVTVGVDPGTFRQFAPKVTASDDTLWRYVAGGSLVSSYEMAADRSLALGKTVTVKPAGGTLAPTTGWLGALASLGLPGVDLVVSHAYSDRLGLTPDSGLIVSAPKMDPYALSASLMSALPGASVELLHAPGTG
jgi:hypothetical protein